MVYNKIYAEKSFFDESLFKLGMIMQ
jgi:hypothetical protein